MRREAPSRATLRRSLAWLWLALWGASLALPVADFARGYDGMRGWMVLVIGPLGVLAGQFGWLGNAALLALTVGALRQTNRPRLELGLAALALACSIDALLWRAMYDDAGEARILAFSAGFYTWQAAVLGAALMTIWHWAPRTRR